MGAKGFIIIILFIVTVIFVIQNLQPIVFLVFFGTKSVGLPLSVWVILFTSAGIISSLIIQGLNNLSSTVSKPVQSPKKTVSFSPKSPSPKPNLPTEEKPLVNPSYQEEFEEIPEPLINENINNNEVNLTDEIQDNSQEEIKEVTSVIINANEEENNDEENNEKNQTRTASLYSYKPKEITEVRPKIVPRNKVYDAPYRVITPPYRDNNSPQNNDNYDDYEEEEWKF